MGTKANAIRALKAKGLSHAHAKRVFETKGSGVERTIRELIELARARDEEHVAAHPPPFTQPMSDAIAVIFAPDSPAAAKLKAALLALSFEVLRKVELVMFAGRDGYALGEVGRVTPSDSREITVSVIGGKRPLHEYLAAGLERARREGINLDGNW